MSTDVEVQRSITRALRERTPEGAEWEHANPYLALHLASHASEAGILDELIADTGFLAVAEPTRLAAGLTAETSPARAYLRAVDRLADLEPSARAALIELTALQYEPAAADELVPRWPHLPWRGLWAKMRRTAFHRTLFADAVALSLASIAGEPLLASGGRDCAIRLWDPITGTSRAVLQAETPVHAVALGEVGKTPLLVSGHDDGRIMVWDPLGGALLAVGEGHEKRVRAIALADVSDKAILVTGDDEGRVYLREPSTAEAYEVIHADVGGVYAVALGHGILALAGSGATITVLDASTLKEIRVLKGHEAAVWTLALAEIWGEPLLASAGQEGVIRLWDPVTGNDRATFRVEGSIRALALGEIDGQPVLASGGDDGSILLWNPGGGAPMLPWELSGGALARLAPLEGVLEGHRGWVRALSLGSAGAHPLLVSSGRDHTLRLWNPGPAMGMAPLGPQKGWVSALTVADIEDGTEWLASGGRDGTVRLLDPLTGDVRETLRVNGGAVYSVALGVVANQSVLAFGCEDGTVRIWRPLTRKRVKVLKGHRGRVSSLTLREIDGQPLLASGGKDGTVRLWDPLNGKSLGALQRGGIGAVEGLELRELMGKALLASLKPPGAVRFTDPITREPRGFINRNNTITAFALDHIGYQPTLATGDIEGTVRTWDLLRTNEVRETLRLQKPSGKETVNVLAWGMVRNERVLASGHENGIVRIWNPVFEELLLTIPTGGSGCRHLAFTSDAVLVVGVTRGHFAIDLDPSSR